MTKSQFPKPKGERISWKRLREIVLNRDGHQCRNCGSAKNLEVHHWQPLPKERDGIDQYGYRIDGPSRIVPVSGLVTVCKVCHDGLTEARTISRISENAANLGPVVVPKRDWYNIFELWELGGRTLPIKIIRQGWYEILDHYMLVERIEIKRWPFGFAWGRYHRSGKAAEYQKIGSAGSFQWRIRSAQRLKSAELTS
jgi:hypothetical protein